MYKIGIHNKDCTLSVIKSGKTAQHMSNVIKIGRMYKVASDRTAPVLLKHGAGCQHGLTIYIIYNVVGGGAAAIVVVLVVGAAAAIVVLVLVVAIYFTPSISASLPAPSSTTAPQIGVAVLFLALGHALVLPRYESKTKTLPCMPWLPGPGMPGNE